MDTEKLFNAKYMEKLVDKGLGLAFFEQKDFEKAALYLKKYSEQLLEISQIHQNDELSDYINNEIKKTKDILIQSLKLYTNKLIQDKNFEKALEVNKQLLPVSDYEPVVLNNIAECFKQLKCFNATKEFFLQSIERDPSQFDVYRNLGDISAFELKNEHDAIKYYEKYIEHCKTNPYVYNMLGHLYASTNRYETVNKQIEYFEKGYNLDPKLKMIVKNLSIVVPRTKNFEKSKFYFDKLMTMTPNNDDHYDYACFLIKNKIFEEGLKHYEYRFQKETGPTAYPKISKPKWDGTQDLSNAKLLVHYEQGFGDNIMFSRYLPILKQVAPNLSYIVQHELVDLFNDSFNKYEKVVDIYSNHRLLDSIDFDYHVPLLSIPYLLKKYYSEMIKPEGYLDVDENLVLHFKNNYFNTDKYKIGIVWQGRTSSMKSERDIPPELLFFLSKLPNVEVYSFQKEAGDDVINNLPADVYINPIVRIFQDFRDTAAALKNLDLFITTDNAVLNLAGALGIPTVGLFNNLNDWRWFDINENDVTWYKSIKPLVLPIQNKWEFMPDMLNEEIKRRREM